MRYDLGVLQKYIDDGWLDCQKHPVFPIKIYNYSRNCTFERKWDDITMAMRGTVINDDGFVVARSFSKFFNVEQVMDKPLQVEGEPTRKNLQELGIVNIPYGKGPISVQDKEDGSLGILFNYHDIWITASKGSFTSPQANKMFELLSKKYPEYQKLDKGICYIFEIIYPENRIVLDYGKDEKLILLAAFEISGGHGVDWEYSLNAIENVADHIKCDFALYRSLTTGIPDETKLRELITKLRDEPSDNKEGYIIQFTDKSSERFRLKVKFEEYCRLHYQMTAISNVDIWKSLSNGEEIKLDNMPDEFDDWFNKTVKDLRYQFMSISEDAGKSFDNIRENFGELPDIKTFIKWIDGQPKWKQSILFKMYRQQNYDEIVWKLVKPKWKKPFMNKDI